MHAFGVESINRFVDGRALATDDSLLEAVDIGDNEVAIDTREYALYVCQRCKDGGHLAVVLYRNVGHFPASGADGFECFGECQDAGLHEGRVFTEAVAHDHVGLHAVGVE